ncbi:MAG: DNA-3-methyladenine glycosylase I, partial [Hyphomonadaceae bacterium]
MSEKHRCGWAPGTDPLYAAYHDEEWGVPEWDGRALWEKLVLDGFQAGLAWITILRKRETMRAAFDNFEPARVARYDERRIEKLLADPGIIRSRAKIVAAIEGARLYNAMAKQGEDFSAYIWSFTGGKPIQNRWEHYTSAPTQSRESEALSKDLRTRG